MPFKQDGLLSLSSGLDRHLQAPTHAECFHAGIESAQPDESGGVTEVLVEQRQIAPRRVVGDVADLGVDAGRRALGGEFPGRVGDLFGGCVVFQCQGQRKHREEIPRRRVVVQRGGRRLAVDGQADFHGVCLGA